MQAVVRVALLVAALAACRGTSTATPDGGGGTDAPPGAAGLHVSWASSPAIPGPTGNNVTVETALFRIDSLRVIGDAGPGDPRTSQSTFEVSWAQGEAPQTLDFAEAPTGLYSKVTVQADGHLVDYSYEITGTVRFNDTDHEYVIHDLNSLTANIDISTMLDPGGGATVPILVRLDDALGVIDFTTLDSDDGKLQLDTFDAQMPAFRDKLVTSFVLGDTSGNN